MPVWCGRLKSPWVSKSVDLGICLFSSHTSYHRYDITEIVLLWRKTKKQTLPQCFLFLFLWFSIFWCFVFLLLSWQVLVLLSVWQQQSWYCHYFCPEFRWSLRKDCGCDPVRRVTATAYPAEDVGVVNKHTQSSILSRVNILHCAISLQSTLETNVWQELYPSFDLVCWIFAAVLPERPADVCLVVVVKHPSNM